MLRIIGGVIAGLAMVFVTVYLVELVGHQIYPVQGEVNLRNPDPNLVTGQPFGAQAFVVAAWFFGAMVGGVVAGRISGRHWTVWAIAGFVVVASIANLFIVPHPTWMQIAAVVAPLIGGFIASQLVPRDSAAVLREDTEEVPSDAAL